MSKPATKHRNYRQHIYQLPKRKSGEKSVCRSLWRPLPVLLPVCSKFTMAETKTVAKKVATFEKNIHISATVFVFSMKSSLSCVFTT